MTIDNNFNTSLICKFNLLVTFSHEICLTETNNHK